MNVVKSNQPWALSISTHSPPVRQALTSLYLGHFSGLCVQQATLRDEVLSSQPLTNSRLASTCYKSGESPKLSAPSLQHNPLHMQ